jgi:hypothetical protein
VAKASVQKLLSEAHQLQVAGRHKRFELAALLYANSEHEVDLRDVLESLGLSYRAGMYLIQIHRNLVLPGKFALERLKKIGWTRLAIICSRLGKGEDRDWVRLAERETTQSLRRLVAGERGKSAAAVFLMSRGDATKLEKMLLRFGAVRRGRALLKRTDALMSMVQQCGK